MANRLTMADDLKKLLHSVGISTSEYDDEPIELAMPATLQPRAYQLEGARWLKRTGRAILADDAGLGKTLQAAMAENYQIRWGSPLPEGFTLIRPEQRAVIPVPGTEHPCENSETRTHESCLYCDGTGWALHKLDMRFDGLIQDRAGRIHVLEHKTFKSHPNVNSLRNSHQFLAYLWGVRQLNMGPVGGLAYDGLWRRDKVPPRREFNDLFLRYTHTRSDAEFEEFGRLLTYQMNEAYALRPEHRPLDTLPFDRRWQGCFDCSFDDSKDGQPGVCSAMSRAEHGLVNVLLNSKFTVRTDDTVDEDETEDAA